jgi:tight adherence protein B
VWLLVRLGVGLVIFILAMFLVGSFLLSLLIAVAAGWLLTRMWLGSRVSKRQKAFADELPDFLLLLASGLRAGLSFTSALDSAAEEGKGEVARQMRRALGEVQLGAQLDDALNDCAERMDSEDLRWTVTALSIQREVGGNLSTILESAADTIKQRFALRREVATLSAEGRLSAYILIALPLGVLAFLTLFRRDYIAALWQSTIGLVMLGTIVVLIFAGWMWMRAIVRIKV